MNRSHLKSRLITLLVFILGSGYGCVNATIFKLYCPEASSLQFKNGQYSGQIEVHEVTAHSQSQLITSTSTGPELEKGGVSFRRTRVIANGGLIDVDCVYNVVISGASKENPLEITFKLDLGDRKLAHSCAPLGCQGESPLTNLCYIRCESK